MVSQGKDLSEIEAIDWQYAIGELNKAQIAALSAAERVMREKAEAEAAAMRAQVEELQSAIAVEKSRCLTSVEENKNQFSEIESRLSALIDQRQKEVNGKEDDSRTAELYEELRRAREMYEKEQRILMDRATDLERQLEMKEAEQRKLMAAKEKRMRERK